MDTADQKLCCLYFKLPVVLTSLKLAAATNLHPAPQKPIPLPDDSDPEYCKYGEGQNQASSNLSPLSL